MKETYTQKLTYKKLERMMASLKLIDSMAIYKATILAKEHPYDNLCWSLLFTADYNVVMKDKEKSRARKARLIILKFSEETRERYCQLANDTSKRELWCNDCANK